MIIRYPELQSGFLAYPSEQAIRRPESVPLTPVQLIVPPKTSRTNQEYFFSPEVELLVDTLVNDVFKTRDLDYHARVMQICGVLFDRKSFMNWMRIQEQSKHISFEHSMFLVDTIRAIQVGTPRLYEPRVWAAVISASNEPSVKPFRAMDVISKVGGLPPDDLSGFLANWVATLGLSDLVTSLQVMFGRRTLHASQGSQRY